MHVEAMQEMTGIIERSGFSINTAINVLDVGSLSVNGSYRELIERRGWLYIGADIRNGPNVDCVMPDPLTLPFTKDNFDIVLSGSTLEHVERPWLLVPEMVRVLRPGGMLVIITHTQWPLHEYPKDYWRFMPSAIELLFDLAGNLGKYNISMFNKNDICGVAWKE